MTLDPYSPEYKGPWAGGGGGANYMNVVIFASFIPTALFSQTKNK